MKYQIPNTLREHRKRSGLLQSDVAFILGLGKRGADRILRWEKGYSCPNTENMLKLSILYGVEPRELYPELAKSIRQYLENIKVLKKGRK